MAEKKKIYVGGRWVETKESLVVTSPYSGERVAEVSLGGPAEMELALASATKAFGELKSIPAYKRATLLRAVSEGIKNRKEDFGRTIAREAGKPITEARVEVGRAVNTFELASEEAKRLGGEVIPLDTIAGAEGRTGIIKRFPVGPVLGISPFNFPLNLVAHKAAPALACGCPIILKPASKTPLSSLLLAEVFDEAVKDLSGGWPDGALSVIPCRASLAEGALKDERIKKLTFTGSPAVGWRLKALVPGKRVTLELGGNAGAIVHDDADIDFAAKRCVVGAFSYAGQICISLQRIYVHEKVFDEFIEKLIKGASALVPGDPLDEGTTLASLRLAPLIDGVALEKTGKWVEEAIAGGAKLLAGGKKVGGKSAGNKSDGPFFSPTVITNTKPEMKVSCEEVFAPVVIVEPYGRFEDAVRLVNDSVFGLQAGVFTRDIKNIFYAYENIEAGGIVAGDVPTFRTDNMPYGGVKQSGFGREGVKYAIEEMTEPRLLVLNLS